MKKLVKILPILIGFLFLGNGCVVETDDYYDDYYWHDDYHYDNNYWHNRDLDIYNYISYGRWYPYSRHGLSQCEYDSYFEYRNWYMHMYDCHNYEYDGGSISIDHGYIHIHYRNGDHEEFYVKKFSNRELILQAHDGHEYHYQRD
ncbi:MAG: hypothetical protein MJZ23_08670 [Paludibacteraceae bacterium]|nr:hypothetical protein [Paludibacteraceae bacterium]